MVIELPICDILCVCVCISQGAGAVICVWDNWRKRPQPTSPSLNLRSCASSFQPFILSQTTSLSPVSVPQLPLLFLRSTLCYILYNLAPWPLTWLSTQSLTATHPFLNVSPATSQPLSFCVTHIPCCAWPKPPSSCSVSTEEFISWQ